MNGLLNHPLTRLVAALLVWVGLGYLGWWWHRPAPLSQPAAVTAPLSAPPTLLGMADLSTDPLWTRLQTADPFALQRANPAAATKTATGAGAPTEEITWRFAALIENHGHSQLLLTADGQRPLLLKVGDKLPNGERIKSIDAHGALLLDAKGHKRTILLIEP